MTKRMLIDATHAEETRVVVLDGNRLEDFDVETSTKKQLKGNIYLAKVVRVEPSLQAAFVEYGGNRHGFLAFGEIHPDYYQIPVADRQRLLAMEAEEARARGGGGGSRGGALRCRRRRRYRGGSRAPPPTVPRCPPSRRRQSRRPGRDRPRRRPGPPNRMRRTRRMRWTRSTPPRRRPNRSHATRHPTSYLTWHPLGRSPRESKPSWSAARPMRRRPPATPPKPWSMPRYCTCRPRRPCRRSMSRPPSRSLSRRCRRHPPRNRSEAAAGAADAAVGAADADTPAGPHDAEHLGEHDAGHDDDTPAGNRHDGFECGGWKRVYGLASEALPEETGSNG